jgi:hypothetical protein
VGAFCNKRKAKEVAVNKRDPTTPNYLVILRSLQQTHKGFFVFSFVFLFSFLSLEICIINMERRKALRILHYKNKKETSNQRLFSRKNNWENLWKLCLI